MTEKQYKRCPICCRGFRLDRFKKHMSQKHGAESQNQATLYTKAKPLEKKIILTLTPEQDLMVKCPTCKRQIKEKNLAKHMRKVHVTLMQSLDVLCIPSHMRKVHEDWSIPMSSPTLEPRVAGELKIGELPLAERKRQLRILFGPDRETSEDIFDRGLVVSGGGYGMGKSRSH